MSVIQLKEINGASIDAYMDEMVIAALARYSRYINEQECQIDLLALYFQLDEKDPFYIHIRNIRERGVTELPILYPLTDTALVHELMSRSNYHKGQC